MNQTAQKGACGQHNASRTQIVASFGSHAATHTAFNNQITDCRLDNLDTSLCHQPLHGGTIKRPVCLRTGAMYSRPTRFVQHAELDTRRINSTRHDPVQRINLADQMPFPQPANGRVARHLANTVGTHGDQHHTPAHAGSSRGGFASCVSSTNNDHIMCHASVSCGICLPRRLSGQPMALTGVYAPFAAFLPAIYQYRNSRRCCPEGLPHR